MKYPFEADFQEILATPESFVVAVFSSLESEFLLLPQGSGFYRIRRIRVGLRGPKEGYSQLFRVAAAPNHQPGHLYPTLPHRHPINSRLHASHLTPSSDGVGPQAWLMRPRRPCLD